MNLAYFPLGLQIPCDPFLTASLLSLIVAGLACADRGIKGLDRCPKAGNIGVIPLLYISMWEIAHSKLAVIKILNAEIFFLFIFI